MSHSRSTPSVSLGVKQTEDQLTIQWLMRQHVPSAKLQIVHDDVRAASQSYSLGCFGLIRF